jgi:uncharacterized BrkB/YihY/UPF0761 family membrane protein
MLRNRLNVHAAACTYYFLISLVPIIALAGWGASAAFERVHAMDLFSTLPIVKGIQRYLSSVGVATSMSIKVVGVFGILYGMWSAASLIRSLSGAFQTIFADDNRRRGFITLLITYVFIPLLMLMAIIFAVLIYALVDILRWALSDVLGLLAPTTFAAVAAAFVSGAFVALAAYAGFMLLAPKRPRPLIALLGATIFSVYFFLLQKGLIMLMGNLISKYQAYGVLGGLLLILLSMFLIFVGLFASAQLTAVLSDYHKLEYYEYVARALGYPRRLKIPFIDRVPFASDKYLTHIKKGEAQIFTSLSLAAMVVKEGNVTIEYSGMAETKAGQGRRFFASHTDKIEITAIEDSRILIVPQEDVLNLFRRYPCIWDYLSLSELA